jgi:hypothetical protein
MQLTHSLKAPGFNPRIYGAKTCWFHGLLSHSTCTAAQRHCKHICLLLNQLGVPDKGPGNGGGAWVGAVEEHFRDIIKRNGGGGAGGGGDAEITSDYRRDYR